MAVKRIILDLDEVLTDFIGGICNLWKVDPVELRKVWEPGRWDNDYDIRHPLSIVLGLSEVMPAEEFWRTVNHFTFWANLPETPWCDEVLKVVEKSVGPNNVHIYTSPAQCESCYRGKTYWLKQKFGPKFDRFAITPHKEVAAKPGVILIDDRYSTCVKFVEEGGDAILFPRHHNVHHWWSNDPVAFLTSQLKLRV